MRAFVPQGYMAKRADSGAIAVTLCGSDGVHLIPLKQGGNPEKERQRAEPPCAFAGFGAPATSPPAVPELPFPAPVALAYADHPAAFDAPAPQRLHPPARGPPLTA